MTETVKIPWEGWEVVSRLGGGSFGSVYKIRRQIAGIDEYAAMKVIPVPADDSESRDLLDRGYTTESINDKYKMDLDQITKEYGIMALLKGHANVVYCDDLRTEKKPDGIGWILYIRMELLTPLTKAIAEPLSESQVIKVGMDLCSALTACRRNNIIHRDIKPANIMVAQDGNYKLGDFGVAKTLEGTSGGTKTGTYNFMAPEVYNNRPYGQSADIYSLGMVLYWMLNRRCPPFLPLNADIAPTALQLDEAKQRRFSGEALPAPADGSAALQQVVLKACAYDPAQRYETPEAFWEALQALTPGNAGSNTYTPWGETADDRSNSWENEYDKTQGSVHSENFAQGGTVGGTTGGTRTGGLGTFDLKATLPLTAQELAAGCEKTFQLGNDPKKHSIKIAPGTKAGTVLRLAGLGKQEPSTGARGDAYITLTLTKSAPDDIWKDRPADATGKQTQEKEKKKKKKKKKKRLTLRSNVF